MNTKGVICAIDVNDFDQQVVDLAAGFAGQFGVDLDLVHVSLFPDPSNAAWPAYLGSPSVIIEDNRRFREVQSNVEGVLVVHHHLSGLPSEKILEFAAKREPLLLVLGTHGRRGLARILGSTAATVLRHANCPVMVMRQGSNRRQLADSGAT